MEKTRKASPNFREKAKATLRSGKPRGAGKGGRGARLTHASAIAEVELRYRIVELRRNGLTHKQISDALGLCPQTIADKLSDILTNTIIKYQGTTEEERQIQLEQIDNLIKTYTPLANDVHNEVRVDQRTKQEVIITVPPDPYYAKVLLDCIRSKAKLLALDIPEVKKLEVTGTRIYPGVNVDEV